MISLAFSTTKGPQKEAWTADRRGIFYSCTAAETRNSVRWWWDSCPWKAHLTTLSIASPKMALTMTFQSNCERESGHLNSRIQRRHSGSPSPPGSFFTAPQRTLTQHSEPKGHRPYTEFHSTHIVSCQINSWYCRNWCGGLLDVFCPSMEDICPADAAPPPSSLRPGLATKLRLQLLRNRMEELLVFKREPWSGRRLLIKQGVVSKKEHIVEDF